MIKLIYLFSVLLIFVACENQQENVKLIDEQSNKLANDLDKEVDITVDFNDSLFKWKLGKDIISEKKIMDILYGNFDTTSRISRWKAKGNLSQQFQSKISADGNIHTKLLLAHIFEQDSNLYIVVITTTSLRDENEDNLENNPTNAPIVGAAIFQNKGRKWFLLHENKALGTFGAYGKLSVPLFAKIGERTHALIFETIKEKDSHYKGAIKILGFINNGFKNLGTLPLWEEYINSEEIENYHTNSELEIIAEKSKFMFDIKVRTRGNRRINDSKNAHFTYVDETKVFSFKEKEYKLVANSFIRSFKPLEEERLSGYNYQWGRDNLPD
jgi:hypothetical protein